MSVSFYCTRCRKLLQYSEDSCGSIIYCPKCNQAIIVPTLTVNETESPQAITEKTTESPREYLAADSPLANSSSSGRVLPQNIPVIHYLNEEAGIRTWSGTEAEEVPMSLPLPEDEVFLQQLDSKPSDTEVILNAVQQETTLNHSPSPAETLVPPPVLAPDHSSEDVPIRIGCFGYFLCFLGFLALAAVIGFGINFMMQIQSKSESEPAVTALHDARIPIDGHVIYTDANHRTRGDENAVVFLFPDDWKPKSPLVMGSLTPGLPIPVEFDRARETLERHGGRFAQVASDGVFDTNIPHAGRYHVLIVSAHCARKNNPNDKKTIKEISQYLYQPEQFLLAEQAFYWKQYPLDQNQYQIEHNFGSGK